MGEGGGASPTRVPRRGRCRLCGLAGGGHDTERGRGILWHWPRVGDLEGGDGDSQSPLHCRHHQPRLPPRITGGSRYRDCHP